MPRAFLITARRYSSSALDADGLRASSPERHVSLAEAGPDHDDLYNLTQLAEVSLAAAAGHVFWPSASLGIDVGDSATKQLECPLLRPVCSPEDRDTLQLHGQHTCGDCGKRYSTASNLARHRQTHRGPQDMKARRCAQCGKLYVSMPAFAMHVRTHSQACRCPYCGKCFSRPWLLQGHIRTHTGEKPFKCTICNKAFADKSNLRAHVQTHSSTKPHVCPRCGKAFALKSYLYKHEESSCMRLHTKPGMALSAA